MGGTRELVRDSRLIGSWPEGPVLVGAGTDVSSVASEDLVGLHSGSPVNGAHAPLPRLGERKDEMLPAQIEQLAAA